MAKLSPFDFINSISETKEPLMVDDIVENQYPSYMVNRGLSFGFDTIILANEMNSRPHIDKKMQYDFLISTVTKKKRRNKWIKAEDDANRQLVQEFYQCNPERAKELLRILTDDDLEVIKQSQFKGGLTK